MNQKGITLIELLVVIIIMGILAIISIPFIGGIVDNAQRDAIRTEAHTIERAIDIHCVQTNCDTDMNSNGWVEVNDSSDLPTYQGQAINIVYKIDNGNIEIRFDLNDYHYNNGIIEEID